MKAQTVIDDSLCAWPEPESLGDDLLPVPSFDLAMLPAAFRDHVSDVAERMQSPLICQPCAPSRAWLAW